MPRKKKAKKKRAPNARGPKEFSVRTQEHRSTGLSGDLQGLSRTPDADSESVSELVEEGNPFEAEIVNAVEAAVSTVNERALAGLTEKERAAFMAALEAVVHALQAGDE